MGNRVAVFRREHFNAAHRLFYPGWDDATNNEVFGKCALPNFHGHNYELEVKVVGIPDVNTGYVMDMKILSDIINKNVLDKFDHRNLNEDCAEFKNLNPTAENIALIIYNILREKISSDLDIKIRLYETEKNFVEFPA